MGTQQQKTEKTVHRILITTEEQHIDIEAQQQQEQNDNNLHFSPSPSDSEYYGSSMSESEDEEDRIYSLKHRISSKISAMNVSLNTAETDNENDMDLFDDISMFGKITTPKFKKNECSKEKKS